MSSAFVERHSLHSEILETLISPEFRHESPKFGLDMRVYRTLRPIFFFFFFGDVLEGAFRHIDVKQKWKCLKPYMQKSSLDLISCGKKTRTEYENMTIPFQEKNPGCIQQSQQFIIKEQLQQWPWLSVEPFLHTYSETLLPVKIPNYVPGATVIYNLSPSLQSRFPVARGKTGTYLDDSFCSRQTWAF